MRAPSLLVTGCLLAACTDPSAGPAGPADTPPRVSAQLAGDDAVVAAAEVKEVPARLDKLRAEVAALEKEQSIAPEIAASITKSVDAARAAALAAEQLPRRQHDPYYRGVSGAMGDVRKALQSANANSAHFTAADEQARVVHDLAEAWARQVNHRIVFTYRADLWEVYPWDPDPATVGPLTSTPRLDEGAPAWSPDGRRLAFVRSDWGSFGTWGTLVVMNADGTGEAEILRSDDRFGIDADYLSWSPDGTRIAFNRLDDHSPYFDGAHRQVCLATVPSSTPVVVPRAADAPCATSPRVHRWTCGADWSPDGATLAVNSCGGHELFLQGLSVGTAIGVPGWTTVPLPDQAVFPAVWSHDGRRIAWTGSRGVYVLDVDTRVSRLIGRVRPTLDGGPREKWVSWSPDDRHLVVSANVGVEVFDEELGRVLDGDLYIMTVESGSVRQLTRAADFEYHVAWRPYVR